jgi:hypothetical protein
VQTGKQMLDYPWALDKDFWTSGTSQGCAGAYVWCSKNKSLDASEARWISGHPISLESCIFINLHAKISGKNSSLGSALCSEKKRFICEVSKNARFIIYAMLNVSMSREPNELRTLCRRVWNAQKLLTYQ